MNEHRSRPFRLLPILFLAANLSQAAEPKQYTISPVDGAIGQDVGVVIRSDETCTEQDPHFQGMRILPAPDIVVRQQEVQSGCLLTAVLVISDKAKLGNRILPIVRAEAPSDAGETDSDADEADSDADEAASDANEADSDADEADSETGEADSNTGRVGFVNFEVTAVQPRPLPPGLKPQVDLMWKILPREVVHDNFGNRIARRYYAVEVMIGNNSGYDLQIAGIGFTMPACTLTRIDPATRLPAFDCTNNPAVRKIPTDGYQIVRGSLEREDEFGRRHFALSAVKTIGLLMTGLIPFFPNPSSDAGEVANFVNNPITQGFELLFPRTTIRQLQRMEVQALHDGMIVPHNAQRRALSFISKRVVGLSKVDRDHPQKAMARLGDMVLVGQQVEYLQRVQVTSQGDGAVEPPVVTNPELGSITQGTAEDLRIVGSNLREVDISPLPGVSGLTVSEIESVAGGHFVDFNVSAAQDARLGSHTLLVRNSDGGFPVTVDVVAPEPEPEPDPDPSSNADPQPDPNADPQPATDPPN